jgi:hypothetical protein
MAAPARGAEDKATEDDDMGLSAAEKTMIVRGGAVYLLVLLLVVAAARLGLLPGAGEVGGAEGPLAHPYRVIMALAGFLLAAALGTWSAVTGVATHRIWLGLMLLAVGGALALLASELAEAILYPDDRYPVAFGWTVGGVPVAVVTWLAATVGGWAAGKASPA